MKKTLPIVVALLAVIVCSCEKYGYSDINPAKTRRTLIVFSAGYNNLCSNLKADIKDMQAQFPPQSESDFYKVIIIAHHSVSDNNWNTPVSPVIIDAYRDASGKAILDTVKSYPNNTVAVSSDFLRDALTYIKENYPSKNYGLLLSSHGTGWLPEGYAYDPESTDYIWAAFATGKEAAVVENNDSMPNPYRKQRIRLYPDTKSAFAQYQGAGYSVKKLYEMDIKDLASSIPMHMDYILMDMCLMGGIECAYQLRNVTDFTVFSPTEILDDGFRYQTLIGDVLYEKEPNLKKVSEDFFNYYSKDNRSASISCIDCRKLDAMSQICSELFEKYRTQIAKVRASSVQRYYRNDMHWFYDLRDILVKSGISEDDLAKLNSALDGCVVYENATSVCFGVKITTHCGFSMFLPNNGGTKLKQYYKTLDWNLATSLVK